MGETLPQDRRKHIASQWIVGLVCFVSVWIITMGAGLLFFSDTEVNPALRDTSPGTWEELAAINVALNARLLTSMALSAGIMVFAIYRMGRTWSYHSQLPWWATAAGIILTQIGILAGINALGTGGCLAFALPPTLATLIFHLSSRPSSKCDRCKQTYTPTGDRRWEKSLHPSVAYRWKGAHLCPNCVAMVEKENQALVEKTMAEDE
jgi:hypothetical protein